MKMDCKNQQPPSVIETLMGLNTQPVEKRQQQRVLSENYRQKASSLQLSQKRLASRTCSSAMQVDVDDLVPIMSNSDYQIHWSDSMFYSSLRNSQDTSLHPRHSRKIKSQNTTKLENRQGTKIYRDAKKSQQKRKKIPYKPCKGRFSKVPEQHFASEIVSYKHDSPSPTMSDPSISFISGNMIGKDENLCSPVPTKVNWIMTHRSLSRPRAHWDTSWYLTSEVVNRSTQSNTRLHITECSGSSVPGNSESVSTNLYETQNDDTYCPGAPRIEHIISDDDDDDIYQEASQSLSEDTLASCQTPEPLSPTSSEEVSRCSPISVLESLSKGGVPSTMDCFMNGSTDLCEVYSEGLGMNVSSDEDNQEEPEDTIQENIEFSSRSYLVSVMSESCGRNNVNYNKWPSFENPISPQVFQILEEKYGRHVSSPRSERKLLFDCINSGLTDIGKSCFGIRRVSASVRQRFSPCWTRTEVEENLWRLLVIQDKQATKTNDPGPFRGKFSSAKKGKKSNTITCKDIKVTAGDFSYLELEDYMDEVITDIERSMLDELVSELL